MTLESKLEELREVMKKVEGIQAVHMPATLAEAYSGEWELLADEVLETSGTAYLALVRGKDSQRVIPMKAAMQVLAQFEEEMVNKMVIKGSALLWKRAARFYNMAKWIVTHPEEIWAAIKDIGEALKQIETLEELSAFVIAYGIELFVIAEIRKTLRVAFEVRGTFESRLRSRAFPQSTGQRFWRKTVATK